MTSITLDEKVLRSNRRFGKALVNMVDEELQKCSSHHVLELEVRVIERQDKPIAKIMPEDKWHALVTNRNKATLFEKIESIVENNKIVRLVFRFGFLALFVTLLIIIIQIII